MATMKKLSTFIASIFLASGVAYAADTSAPAPSNITIGVINIDQILSQTPQAKSAAEQLKKTFQPRQQKIVATQKALQDDEAKLKRDGTVMSSSDMQALQSKISMENRDLQQMQDDYVQDIRTAQSQAMQKVLTQVGEVVQKIAKQGNYDVIIQKNAVPFNSARVDITPEVIKEMES